MRFTKSHNFSQADFDLFAALSGDDNPIHVDPAFAARTRFGRTVAHGMLLYGVICGLLSEHFPDAQQLEQNFIFPLPTFADEPITINTEIMEVMTDRQAVRLRTCIKNEAGELTCDGETVLGW
ncbi:MAG: MaoC family dehydratase [Anaerolineales bacterium]|nr:MaoC family dehydratase [Anaerolineales bacterium]